MTIASSLTNHSSTASSLVAPTTWRASAISLSGDASGATPRGRGWGVRRPMARDERLIQPTRNGQSMVDLWLIIIYG